MVVAVPLHLHPQLHAPSQEEARSGVCVGPREVLVAALLPALCEAGRSRSVSGHDRRLSKLALETRYLGCGLRVPRAFDVPTPMAYRPESVWDP